MTRLHEAVAGCRTGKRWSRCSPGARSPQSPGRACLVACARSTCGTERAPLCWETRARCPGLPLPFGSSRVGAHRTACSWVLLCKVLFKLQAILRGGWGRGRRREPGRQGLAPAGRTEASVGAHRRGGRAGAAGCPSCQASTYVASCLGRHFQMAGSLHEGAVGRRQRPWPWLCRASLPPLSRQLGSTREIVSLRWQHFPTPPLAGKGGGGGSTGNQGRGSEKRSLPLKTLTLFSQVRCQFPWKQPGAETGNQNPETRSLALLFIALPGFQLPFPQGNWLRTQEPRGRRGLQPQRGSSPGRPRHGRAFVQGAPAPGSGNSQESSRQLGPRPLLGRFQLLASCGGM